MLLCLFVLNVVLHWSVAGGAWQTTSMTDSGDGRYRGVIPGQTEGKVIQFYVEGRDSNFRSSTYPAAGVDSRSLYQVDSTLTSAQTVDTIQVIITQADKTQMYLPQNVMSNEFG